MFDALADWLVYDLAGLRESALGAALHFFVMDVTKILVLLTVVIYVMGLLLGVAGAVIGTLLSLTAIYVLNVVHLTFAFARQVFVLAPTIGAGEVLIVGATVIGVAVLASLQPAWKAARMDPIMAPRHV